MAESTIMGYEHFPTSGVQGMKNTEEIMKTSATLEEKRVAEFRDRLEKVEIKNERYDRLILAAKKDLENLYEEAGINIKDEDFPKVYIIPHDLKQGFNARRDSLGSFGIKSMGAIIYALEGKLILNDIGAIHHELHHGIGRVALVTSNDKSVALAQLGHSVTGKNRITGDVLEEGLMTYFQRKFILNSNQRDIIKARARYASLMGYKDGKRDIKEFEYLWTGVRNKGKAQKIIQNLTKENDSPDNEDSRAAAVEMVTKLIDRAIEIDDKQGGQKMEALLLYTRKFPKQRKKLLNYINDLFGPKAAKFVFTTLDDFNLIRQTNKILRLGAKFQDSKGVTI